jgi:hypothetical protein
MKFLTLKMGKTLQHHYVELAWQGLNHIITSERTEGYLFAQKVFFIDGTSVIPAS